MDERTILEILFARARAIGVDPLRDSVARGRLEEAARKASVELRATKRTQVNLPFLGATENGPVHLEVELPPTGGRGHGGGASRLDPRERLD